MSAEAGGGYTRKNKKKSSKRIWKTKSRKLRMKKKKKTSRA